MSSSFMEVRKRSGIKLSGFYNSVCQGSANDENGSAIGCKISNSPENPLPNAALEICGRFPQCGVVFCWDQTVNQTPDCYLFGSNGSLTYSEEQYAHVKVTGSNFFFDSQTSAFVPPLPPSPASSTSTPRSNPATIPNDPTPQSPLPTQQPNTASQPNSVPPSQPTEKSSVTVTVSIPPSNTENTALQTNTQTSQTTKTTGPGASSTASAEPSIPFTQQPLFVGIVVVGSIALLVTTFYVVIVKQMKRIFQSSRDQRRKVNQEGNSTTPAANTTSLSSITDLNVFTALHGREVQLVVTTTIPFHQMQDNNEPHSFPMFTNKMEQGMSSMLFSPGVAPPVYTERKEDSAEAEGSGLFDPLAEGPKLMDDNSTKKEGEEAATSSDKKDSEDGTKDET
ncbi:hypothetical protein HDU97_004737 [Phlyctochytrium planicorne]|nr:hypothetical protein HDU97_004737 [Phlyctochytrium planicorne]